ncbi:MAG: DNA-protecting protein DprA [Spirochaetes bacterium]|nr:DNA-protecting protein DprA [Spirochaetota bacterium]
MEKNNDLFMLAVNRIGFLRPYEKISLAESVKDPGDIFALKKKCVEYLMGRRFRAAWIPEEYLKSAENDIKNLTGGKISYTFYWDTDYPPQLREIYDPPFVLFYRGRMPVFDRPFFAVVGTRRPTGRARRAANTLAYELAGCGTAVVSGLARGIDAEVHLGVLERGGCTLAVLGNGIDFVYPSSNRRIGIKILLSSGALISEYPPGEPPLKYHFPERNRIISGLSKAVIIVQAPEKSGALITADFALEQGRDLYVHSAGLYGQQGRGTRLLYEEGAPVIESAEQIPGLADCKMQVSREISAKTGTAKSAAAELAESMRRELYGVRETMINNIS